MVMYMNIDWQMADFGLSLRGPRNVPPECNEGFEDRLRYGQASVFRQHTEPQPPAGTELGSTRWRNNTYPIHRHDDFIQKDGNKPNQPDIDIAVVEVLPKSVFPNPQKK